MNTNVSCAPGRNRGKGFSRFHRIEANKSNDRVVHERDTRKGSLRGDKSCSRAIPINHTFASPVCLHGECMNAANTDEDRPTRNNNKNGAQGTGTDTVGYNFNGITCYRYIIWPR